MQKSLSYIAALLKLPCEQSRPIRTCQIDSREVQKGDLFFAITGKKVDGHQFLQEVAQKGAVGAVVSSAYQGEAYGLPLFRVDDVGASLQYLAKEVFKTRQEKVIAVTGSMGKTTTKEFLATLLSAKYKVGKTKGNQNTQLTFPLQILNLEEPLDWLVLEMAMNKQGEIAKLVQIAPPYLSIVTRIAPAGLERFEGGLEAVAKAKAEIFSHPRTEWGLISAQAAQFSEVLYRGGVPKKLYSWKEPQLDPRSVHFMMEAHAEGVVLLESDGSMSPPMALQFEASHLRENFLAAAAAARMLGLSWEEIRQKAKELTPFPKRFETIKKGGITFIQDCYNANPESMRAAFENLPRPEAGGKVVGVLGSMPDLGERAHYYHQCVGQWARSRFDCLLLVGEDAKEIQAAFCAEGKPGEHFSSLASVKEALERLVKPGDVVLIKGGNGHKLWELLEK